MRHEKVIKRDDGSEVIIDVLLNLNYGSPKYHASIWVIPNIGRKRLVNPNLNHDIATPAEILAAKLELWEKIKPC